LEDREKEAGCGCDGRRRLWRIRRISLRGGFPRGGVSGSIGSTADIDSDFLEPDFLARADCCTSTSRPSCVRVVWSR